jgi:F-type H+-transporting ATPase subunit epsilon
MMRVEDGEVLILVDSAEWPDEIDAERVKAKEAAAREAMLQKKSAREYTLAEASLKRAVARLKVKSGGDL